MLYLLHHMQVYNNVVSQLYMNLICIIFLVVVFWSCLPYLHSVEMNVFCIYIRMLGHAD